MICYFHIKNLYDARYRVSAEVKTLSGETISLEPTTRRLESSLKDFIRGCVQVLSSAKTNLAKTKSFPAVKWVWDEDTSELPSFYQRLAQMDKPMSSAPKEVKSEPQLFEIKKVNDVYTIVKHEKELKTWEEAVAELKEKVGA